MKREQLVSILLRIGIAITFLYAAVGSFLNPSSWIGFFPEWMRNLVPDNVILSFFSVYEIILGVWLISGKKLFYSALLASLTLLGIIIFNLSAFDIIFRDVAILFSAVALVFIGRGKK